MLISPKVEGVVICPSCKSKCRIVGKTTLYYERLKKSKKKCIICINPKGGGR